MEHKACKRVTETLHRLRLQRWLSAEDSNGYQCCVVDGGSRGTRCYVYSLQNNVLVRAFSKKHFELLDGSISNDTSMVDSPPQSNSISLSNSSSSLSLETLLLRAQATAKDGGIRRAASILDSYLTANGVSPSTTVFIGGTAGIRQAIRYGRLNDSILEKVEMELATTMKRPDTWFEIVEGMWEGRFELDAMRMATLENLGVADAGLFPLGGQSTQIVDYGGSEVSATFQLGIKSCVPQDMGDKEERIYFRDILIQATKKGESAIVAAERWRDICRLTLAHPQGRDGFFIGVSTNYWIAIRAGIASQTISVTDAKIAISLYEQRLVEQQPMAIEWLKLLDDKPNEAEKLSGAVALGVMLDRLLTEDAKLYFEREWTVGGHVFVTNWSTGKALHLLGLLGKSAEEEDKEGR